MAKPQHTQPKSGLSFPPLRKKSKDKFALGPVSDHCQSEMSLLKAKNGPSIIQMGSLFLKINLFLFYVKIRVAFMCICTFCVSGT